MPNDTETNTITAENSSDILVISGVLFIQMLQKEAALLNAPSKVKTDWSTIAHWLNYQGGELTLPQQHTIKNAWKAYLAIGLAPSLALEPTFRLIAKQFKENGHSISKDKPPTEVMRVFDRMLATEKEITIKRNQDFGGEDNRLKIEAAAKKIAGRNLTLSHRLALISKEVRILVCGSIAWTMWVSFRTIDRWELLGFRLPSWGEDMFLLNVGLPITVVWLAYQMYKWINSSDM